MVDAVVEIEGAADKVFIRLKKALSGEKLDTLAFQIGKLFLAQAQRAFEEQKLGDFPWPMRYPNQREPFINLAAALVRFNQGLFPLKRHFDRRPALIDTAGLLRSLRDESNIRKTGEFEVEVGSRLPYAKVHQEGGMGEPIPISDIAKAKMREFLFGKKGAQTTLSTSHYAWQKMGKLPLTKKGGPYLSKLRPLLKKKEYVVQVNQRPFMGLTTQLRDDIVEHTTDFFREATA